MLWLYRLLFLPLLVVFATLFGWRMRGRESVPGALAHRLGAVPVLPAPAEGVRRVWLQAVSVGELLAAGPVIEALADRADVEVFLTTTTGTSQLLARERFGARMAGVATFPIDFWPFVARAWRRVRPDVLILCESERWPEHIAQARRLGVPVVCINARISDRSFQRMRAVRAVVPGLMAGVTRMLAVSGHDAERFRELGFAPGVVGVTGNLKVDTVMPHLDPGVRVAWRAALGFGPDDLVLLGASTWPGEEAALLEAWRQARPVAERRLRLLLVPRHAERRAEVVAEVARAGVRHHLRSQGDAPGDIDVCIADTTGELAGLTQLADIVFVGRSLAPHRCGQTPVEAAGAGRALVFGPGMTNFRAIAGALVECGAARRVRDASALCTVVRRLAADTVERERLGRAGAAWHRANRGALACTLRALEDVLPHASEDWPVQSAAAREDMAGIAEATGSGLVGVRGNRSASRRAVS